MRYCHTTAAVKYPDPGTFAGLMELYEQCYMRLRCLCLEAGEPTDLIMINQSNDDVIRVKLLEKTNHTTILRITHIKDDQNHPDLVVRVYHDAQTAEAVSTHSVWLKEGATMRYGREYVAKRWTLNRYFYQWLGRCLLQEYTPAEVTA